MRVLKLLHCRFSLVPKKHRFCRASSKRGGLYLDLALSLSLPLFRSPSPSPSLPIPFSHFPSPSRSQLQPSKGGNIITPTIPPPLGNAQKRKAHAWRLARLHRTRSNTPSCSGYAFVQNVLAHVRFTCMQAVPPGYMPASAKIDSSL